MYNQIEFPLVTILIPTHNYGCYLSEAIESCIKQNYRPLEIIVVDDESTDNTAEIVAKYPNVRYFKIKHEGEPTPANALNFGMKKAHGSFICGLGADDIMHPDYVRMCYGRFINNGNKTGLVWAGQQQFGALHYYGLPCMDKSRTRYSFHVNPSGALGNMFISKAVTDKVGEYDIKLKGCEDWDYAIRILLKGYQAVAIREPYIYVRIHPVNSHNHLTVQKEAIIQLRHKYPLMNMHYQLTRLINKIGWFTHRDQIIYQQE